MIGEWSGNVKRSRQNKILELIERYEIETQEDLAKRLLEAGFQVTQATVSRDIRELALTKVSGRNGKPKYAVTDHGGNPPIRTAMPGCCRMGSCQWYRRIIWL